MNPARLISIATQLALSSNDTPERQDDLRRAVSTAYYWSNYEERLHHAETHLNEFIFMADHGRSDLVIGQQAQNALEHGMKALIAATGGQYSNTHDIWNPDRQHPPLRPGDAGITN